jgi:nicotinate phosphoribosyltransferase
MEFGLRRAQGPDGAMSATRAAYIGGANGTSNTLAAKRFGIPVMGTMAHSWVMSFPSEYEAFSAYADVYPDRAVFLIDTYDTLNSGIKNAIAVGKRLQAAGKKIGVRLDSGDMHYLSVEVRKALDAAGLTDATIAVSNDLDESIVQTLVSAGAPIDNWGVGTQMVTGGSEASFTGVYKLAAKADKDGRLVPSMKFSDNPEKTTNPGVKQVWRMYDRNGLAFADALALDDPSVPDGAEVIRQGETRSFWHPSVDYRHFHRAPEGEPVPLLQPCMRSGEPCAPLPGLQTIRERVKTELDSFDGSFKRLLNPHVYKVAVTERLKDLKLSLIREYLGEK